MLTERFTAIRQDWATLGPDVTDFQHRLITPKSGRMILSHRSARPDIARPALRRLDRPSLGEIRRW